MSLTASSCCSDSRRKDITRLPALRSRRLPVIGAAGLLALERIPSLVDVDRLLSDEAWS